MVDCYLETALSSEKPALLLYRAVLVKYKFFICAFELAYKDYHYVYTVNA